jgi:hypothetical protein
MSRLLDAALWQAFVMAATVSTLSVGFAVAIFAATI